MDTHFTFVFAILLAILCTSATALRFVASKRILGRLGAEDWLAFAALVSFLAYISLVLASVLGQREPAILPIDEEMRAAKMIYATVPFYPLNQFFAKLSILFLYHRLFSINRHFVRWTYVLGTAQSALTILTIFINIFGCRPISYNWNFTGDDGGWCLDQVAVFTGTESVNSAIDFAMVALASAMVAGIRLTFSTRLKLMLLFFVGGLSGIIGFLRIGGSNLYGKEKDSRLFGTTHIDWTVAQQAASIVCCCAPMYRGAFSTRELCARLASRAGQYTCWRRRLSTSDEPNAHRLWLVPDDSSQSRLAWTELNAGIHRVPGIPIGVRTTKSNERERLLLRGIRLAEFTNYMGYFEELGGFENGRSDPGIALRRGGWEAIKWLAARLSRIRTLICNGWSPMRILRRFWQSRFRFRSPPPVARYNKLATAGTKTTTIAMAAYICTVAAQPVSTEASEKTSKSHHIKNSRGETIKFQNPHPSHVWPPISVFAPAIIKGMLTRSEAAKPKLEDKLVPVVKPQFLPTRTASSELRATWLGHACYYVEYPSGLRVLFDPVFEDCCAPVNFLGFKRYTERPCDIADIPYVDAVVISHSHYDHLSYPSVQEVKKHHPDAHFFVGLGLEKWFRSSGIDKVTEMDWWDEAEVTFTPTPTKEADTKLEPIKAKIACLPSQHSSGRTGFDKDHTLWASWGIKSSEKIVWFGGDTGYRTVPKVAEGIDGLGPGVQALAQIFRDTNCKRAMAIHWGTWVLTPEHPLEPPKLLKEALKRKGLPETGLFDVCDIDEATILSIAGDYKLHRPEEFAAAREVLLAISKNVEAEEATGFNPSGFGGQDSIGILDSHDGAGSEAISAREGDLKRDPGFFHVNVFEDDLTMEEKERQLAAMFISLKPIDIKLTLQKTKGDVDLAMDELLNLQWLEERGQRPKGVDGFYVSDDDIPKGKKKERRKTKKASKVVRLRTPSEESSRGEAVSNDNISFISDRFALPVTEAAAIYQRNKFSLGDAILAILDNYISLGLESGGGYYQQRQAEEQKKRIPWIPSDYFSPIFNITTTSRAAIDVIDVLANHFEKPAYLKHDVSYSVVASDVELIPEVSGSTGPDSSWTHISSSTTTKPNKGQRLRTAPTTLPEASAAKATIAASAKHSYASASSAFKKGKSDPLMRQAGAFYAERARSEAASHREAVSFEAKFLVDRQSTRDTIDLHGVPVEDGVTIALERVWHWWNALSDEDRARNRVVRDSGLKVVTGLGRHNPNGKSRLRINVCKALVADGWRIEVLTGAYLVTGRI
ncbi:hypothetical protein CIB48_g8657 [Xylaria polymorpha]|nr:hypothetical protein CIB48_g8657 [Xylaria polymorpha]